MDNESSVAELARLRQRVAELEEALQHREAKASLLLDSVPLGIHACDLEGRITFVNPFYETLTGYAADELLGRHVWELIEAGAVPDSLPEYLRRLVSEQPPPTPLIAKSVRKNGEVFDVHVDWIYHRDPLGRVTGFTCIACNVTEQMRAEGALRESERRLSTLISNLPGMAYRCRNDRQWAMEFISDGCISLTGYAPQAFMGVDEVAYGDVIHPDDRAPRFGMGCSGRSPSTSISNWNTASRRHRETRSGYGNRESRSTRTAVK